MTKVIKNLSNKLVKMELENKNPQRQVQQNRGFNTQFRRKKSLQILQRERRDKYQVQAPLYLVAGHGESVADDEKEVGDQISDFYIIEDDEEGDCE